MNDLPLLHLVVLVISAGSTIYGLYRRDLAARMLTWPTTEGRISDLRVEEYQDEHPDGPSYTMHRPVIAYDYRVGDREYRARRFGGATRSTSWRSGAEAILRQHPKGQLVTVHVNPKNPSDAIVDPKAELRASTVLASIGVVVLLTSVVVWLNQGA